MRPPKFPASLGLSHMHNSKPKAFHRDIKSANILLDWELDSSHPDTRQT